MAKAEPGKMSFGGSGLNSANHAAHEKLNIVAGSVIFTPAMC